MKPSAAATATASATRMRWLNIGASKHFASLASTNDIQDMAHFAATACEMLDDIRRVAIAARDNDWSLEPKSLVAFLDDNAPQLIRATAQPIAPQKDPTT